MPGEVASASISLRASPASASAVSIASIASETSGVSLRRVSFE